MNDTSNPTVWVSIAELQAAVYEVEAGRNGDVNDLVRLRHALNLALARWPEVNPYPPVWHVAQAHVDDHSRPEVLLHLEHCPHFYTDAERAAESIRDPDVRQTTAGERALTLDGAGRTWRHCQHCDAKAAKGESWPDWNAAS
jgi:hypothetical protein